MICKRQTGKRARIYKTGASSASSFKVVMQFLKIQTLKQLERERLGVLVDRWRSTSVMIEATESPFLEAQDSRASQNSLSKVTLVACPLILIDRLIIGKGGGFP